MVKLIYSSYESLAEENTVPFEPTAFNSIKNLAVLWNGPKGISSKILFRRLAFCVCVNAMLLDGVYSVWALYVREAFDFTRQQATLATVSFGGGRTIVLFVLLRPLLDRFGERGTLLVGLFSNLVFTIYYAFFVVSAWNLMGAMSVYIGSFILAFGAVCFPAIATIKSSKCPPDEQGRVLGALNGIQLMAWGLGPMIFNNIFAWLIDKQAQKAFTAAVGGVYTLPLTSVWWLGILMSIWAILLAWSIPDPRTVTVASDATEETAAGRSKEKLLERPFLLAGTASVQRASTTIDNIRPPPWGARICDTLLFRYPSSGHG